MKKAFLISAIIFIVIPLIVWAIGGGVGKAKGNSCMAQCMGINAEFYDASNELTQFCQAECNVGTGQGSCLTSQDGCCVLYTGDPDCIVYPECMVNEDCNSGEFCELPAGQCGASNLIGTCQTVPIYCLMMWDPVCGCDNITYSNDCHRQKAQAQLDHTGGCGGEGPIIIL